MRLPECKALIPAALGVRRLAQAADLDEQARALVARFMALLLAR